MEFINYSLIPRLNLTHFKNSPFHLAYRKMSGFPYNKVNNANYVESLNCHIAPYFSYKLQTKWSMVPFGQRNFLHSSPIHLFLISNTKRKKTFENPYAEMLEKKKLKNFSPLIKLIDTNDKISVMTWENANKLAFRRNLKLLKVEDPQRQTKRDKPLYQLLTGKQYFDEDMAKRKEKLSNTGIKGKKIVQVSSNVAPSDVNVKVKKINQLLDKCYEVQILIESQSSSQTSEKVDNILTTIQKATEGNGQISQMVKTNQGLKFTLTPNQPAKENTKT